MLSSKSECVSWVISFLYEYQSAAHRFYKAKVDELRRAASGSEIQTSSRPAAPQTRSQEHTGPALKRKRKSRWGAEDDKAPLATTALISAQIPAAASPSPALTGTHTHTCAHRSVTCLNEHTENKRWIFLLCVCRSRAQQSGV